MRRRSRPSATTPKPLPPAAATGRANNLEVRLRWHPLRLQVPRQCRREEWLFRLTCVEVIIFYILLIDALGANLVVHFGSKWYVQHFRAISRASSARTMTLSFSKTGKQRQNSGMSLS